MIIPRSEQQAPLDFKLQTFEDLNSIEMSDSGFRPQPALHAMVPIVSDYDPQDEQSNKKVTIEEPSGSFIYENRQIKQEKRTIETEDPSQQLKVNNQIMLQKENYQIQILIDLADSQTGSPGVALIQSQFNSFKRNQKSITVSSKGEIKFDDEATWFGYSIQQLQELIKQIPFSSLVLPYMQLTTPNQI